LLDIHHEHFDMGDLALQNFEEDIVFDNESDANPDNGSDDALELISILQTELCLPFLAKYTTSIPFSRPLSKLSLSTIGAIAMITTSSSILGLFTMAIDTIASST